MKLIEQEKHLCKLGGTVLDVKVESAENMVVLD